MHRNHRLFLDIPRGLFISVIFVIFSWILRFFISLSDKTANDEQKWNMLTKTMLKMNIIIIYSFNNIQLCVKQISSLNHEFTTSSGYFSATSHRSTQRGIIVFQYTAVPRKMIRLLFSPPIHFGRIFQLNM